MNNKNTNIDKKKINILKKSGVIFSLLGIFNVLILAMFLTGCDIIKKNNLKAKNNVTQEKEISAEKMWNERVRFLCETDCKDFDNPQNLKKEYILEVCQYYKILSSSNIEYDEKLRKYIISEIEIKEIVKELLGIDDFKFDDKDYYDENKGIYFFDDYMGFFDDEEYEDMDLKKIDDERMDFMITVIDGKTKNKRVEHYILKKREGEKYYIASKKTD